MLPTESTEGMMGRRDRRILLVLVWALGALIRAIPVMQFPGSVERPFGMGGLYLLFAQEILRGGFALPVHIPYYTLHGLPYAYPPLAFYVEALSLRLVPLPTFVLVNGLPLLFSCLTIGVFYLLAQELLREPRRALLATAVYALLPAAFLEHLPGEGLVEGLGTLLFIGGVVGILRLNRRPGWPETVAMGVLIGLNILASPGGAYGLAVSVAVLWLLRAGGRRAPLGRLLLAGGIGLLMSAPYWLTVSLYQGPAIFVRTFTRQHANLGALLLAKLGFLVDQQIPLSPWGILAIIGLAFLLARREWALPLWCVVVYVIPREFTYLVAVPLALLATCGLADVVAPAIFRSPDSPDASYAQGGASAAGQSTQGRAVASRLALLLLFVWGTIRAVAWGATLPVEKDLVTTEEMAAMAWVRQDTPTEASFLVIGDEIEWFPVLSERTTLNVIWGSEWVADDTVFHLAQELDECSLPGCYLETAGDYDLIPDYIYISRGGDLRCPIEVAYTHPSLELAWENGGASVFRVHWPSR